MAAGGDPKLPVGVDPLALARRYEPVIRYTKGELFFPMSVETYVARAAVWARPAGTRQSVCVADHGTMSTQALGDLAAAHLGGLELRFVPGPLDRAELRRWRRDPDRPRFTSTSRFAAVGLLGRTIDSLFRFSLVMRGAVPGGLTAAVHVAYRQSPDVAEHPYYVHVSTHGGYVVLQYWFFYAMNDWRSTFGGVNDHEADWEQVTIFLAPIDDSPAAGAPADDAPADDAPDGDVAVEPSAGPAAAIAEPRVGSADGSDCLRLVWVAFSSHDETGDDLRRRPDDPDITWVDGTHPVVHAGAGSHSGAYLSGEYLVRVAPPALRRMGDTVARIRATLLPWERRDAGRGLGIPYIDYKRGDGRHIGPGTENPWTPTLIDASTPWVRDFGGLWGLDTDDPFGGERAPAGPRYERNGSIRVSWADPVAWAGLDKVPATRAAREEVVRDRLRALDVERRTLTVEIEKQEQDLQQVAASAEALPPALAADRRGHSSSRRAREGQTALAEIRADRRRVVVEREHLVRAQADPAPVGPHHHLRKRALPDVDPERPPGLLLRFWTEVSLSVLLALLGIALLIDKGSALWITVAAIAIVMTIEAILRRRLWQFLFATAALAILVGVVVLIVTNVRVAIGALLVVSAVAVFLANLRAYFLRRG